MDGDSSGSDSGGDTGTKPPAEENPEQDPDNPPATGDYPQYKEGTKYKGGDIVSNNGKNYQCNFGPTAAWCSGAAWAYAPDTGIAWQDAWSEYSASSDSNGNTGG